MHWKHLKIFNLWTSYLMKRKSKPVQAMMNLWTKIILYNLMRQQDIQSYTIKHGKNHKLEGYTEIVISSNDESITWKVVKEVTVDELKVAQE